MNNEDIKNINLRKYRDYLRVGGLAVIIFGIWSVIKTFLLYFLGDLQYMMEDELGATTAVEKKYFLYVTIFVLVIDLILRLITGLSARAEGKGKKKSIAYIIIAIILAIFSVLSLVSEIISLLHTYYVVYYVASIIFEIASLFAIFNVIIYSLTIRKITKNSEAKE